MTSFLPLLSAFSTCQLDGQGNGGVGQEVPAGSSFINQIGHSGSVPGTMGKTNRSIVSHHRGEWIEGVG
jgi:hypothetical protein